MRIDITEIKKRKGEKDELEESFSRFGRAGDDEFAFSPLGQKWTYHLVHSNIPPWHIYEYLFIINTPI